MNANGSISILAHENPRVQEAEWFFRFVRKMVSRMILQKIVSDPDLSFEEIESAIMAELRIAILNTHIDDLGATQAVAIATLDRLSLNRLHGKITTLNN